ncbi:ABC transporter substrate-binding protein [Paenarthrobacter sp. PH39-S1]|uniref:peptide ABC transporter substrate-binding protein n=1 Tax=Paenarthrobacter sp. PH39-S1 TaxID=3046204 RepID=UPI0024BA541C|nr:ABC transporter substrate-binding protein [Paenarthrobacter sp. PH39-S1]MDJ0355652.1 ABC transporter substrate-binding protein [Paenarthrobacter sp. PH39-S1]
MRFSRISKALGVATVVALAMTACSGGSTGTTNTSADTTKVITAFGGEPQNPLLPANTNEVYGGRVMDLIFSGLLSYDASGKTVNEMADSIDSTDSQNYTIKIKSGEKFSDGSPITAKNFVDAWNFGALSTNAQLNSYFFESIEGYKDVSAMAADGKTAAPTAQTMSGLKVVDDTTFTVKLAQAESDWKLRLGYTAFFPLTEAAIADPKAAGEKPTGNGPYTLKTWNHNAELDLVPNPNYTGPRKPKNAGVTFKVYTTADAAYQDLLADNLDVLDGIPASSIKSFQKDLGDRSIVKAYAGNATLTIPSYLPAFQGEAGQLRRQAISKSIDRNLIIDKIFNNTKKVAKDFTSPVIEGYSDSVSGADVLTYDASAAKKLWDQANAITPWDNSTFTIAYNVDGAGNKEYVDAATNQIKNALGIQAEGKPYATFKELRNDVNKKQLTGASRAGWQADYPSLYNFLGPLYGTGAGSNDGNYSNPAFDAKLKEGLNAKSTDEGNKIFNEAQQILFKDLPVIPLWYQAQTGGWSNNVTGVDFGWNGVPLYYNISGK